MRAGNGIQVTSQRARVLTSESVAEGHPDKVCDYIADSILDALICGDTQSRVACELLCRDNQVVVAGEINSRCQVGIEEVVRQAVRDIGYSDPDEPFAADTLVIDQLLTAQSTEISTAVDGAADGTGQGAGDQG